MTGSPLVAAFLGAAAALLALGGTLALGVSGGAHSVAEAQQRDEPTQIRELAERFLATSAGYGPPGAAQTARLYPGGLPAEGGVDFPLPPGGQLAGSIVRSYGDQPYSLQVLVDSPSSPTAVLRFYEDTLIERGWRYSPFGGSSRPSGGFQSAPVQLTSTLCDEARDLVLTVQVDSATRGTEARLSMLYPGDIAYSLGPGGVRMPFGPTSRPPMCAALPTPPVGPTESVAPMRDPLPALVPPLGGRIESTTRTSGVASLGSEALFESDLAVAQLEAHFARQLEGEGWTRRTGGANGPLAWSEWLVPAEEERRGWLFALEPSKPGRRVVVLRIETTTDGTAGPPGSPYSTYTTPYR